MSNTDCQVCEGLRNEIQRLREIVNEKDKQIDDMREHGVKVMDELKAACGVCHKAVKEAMAWRAEIN